MKKHYTKLEKDIDIKIRHKKKKKRTLGDLKTATSLGWIFITPIILSIFLGNYFQRFFEGREDIVMFMFIFLGTIFSCINIIYVVKSLYKENCKK